MIFWGIVHIEPYWYSETHVLFQTRNIQSSMIQKRVKQILFGKSSSVQPYETSPTIHSLSFKEASADTLLTVQPCKVYLCLFMSSTHVN